MNRTLSLHIYQTPFTNDSRIVKESRALVESQVVDECMVIAMGMDGMAEWESFGEHRHVHRLPLRLAGTFPGRSGRALSVVEWLVRVVVEASRIGPTVLHAHSVTTLPVGVWVKQKTGARLVYDAHELETESASAIGFKKPFTKAMESSLINRADEVLVVSESIANWYRRRYGLTNITVVRNVPDTRHLSADAAHRSDWRRSVGVPDDALLFLYQGLLGRGRGVELTLEAFSRLDPDKHVCFLGYGPLEPMVKKAASRFKNVHFCPAVPPDRVMEITRNADVGLALIEDICLSYRYCLPNKLFEYVLSGVPVIASDFPEMGRVIDEQRCGWRIPVNGEALAQLISRLDSTTVDGVRQEMRRRPISFGWQHEAEKLVRVYQRCLGTLPSETLHISQS